MTTEQIDAQIWADFWRGCEVAFGLASALAVGVVIGYLYARRHHKSSPGSISAQPGMRSHARETAAGAVTVPGRSRRHPKPIPGGGRECP